MTRWVFVLVFLAYLFGPSRAVEPERAIRENPAVGSVARPVAVVLAILYPQVSVQDRGRWTVRLVCGLCTAGAVALTLLTLRRFASSESALLLAVSAGFASPLWSWTSRSDMPAAVATLGVALVLWLAIGRSEGASRLATGVDRAVGALAAVVIVLGTRRLMPAGTLALFDPAVFAAYLVSPGRGLVFFVPVAVLAAVALLSWKGSPAVLCSSASVALVVLCEIACRSEPWGSMAFGPSLLSPYLPVFAVMAAGLPSNWLRAGALLSVPAVLAHGAAVFMGGHTWDESRGMVRNPEAVWDFADSPFTDLAFGPPRPDPATFAAVDYVIQPGDHLAGEGNPIPWLAYGWEKPEAGGTWASGRESWIVIAAPPGEYLLTLVASAPRRNGKGQRVVIERPAEPSLDLSFTKDLWEMERLSIPLRTERNISVLKLRPAQTWMPGRGDVRRCSIFLTSLRLQEMRIP